MEIKKEIEATEEDVEIKSEFDQDKPISEESEDEKLYIAGIDEAGRGPVFGPLVYGIFFIPKKMSEEGYLSKKYKVKDSKKLKADQRERISNAVKKDEKVKNNYILKVMTAEQITKNMLSRANKRINLNDTSKGCVVSLIKEAQERIEKEFGGKLSGVFVDTIMRKCEIYQSFLERNFPNLSIRVEKKADDLFPIVSAASIMAKVERDRIVEKMQNDLEDKTIPLGSGYPSDPKTKNYLKNRINKTFGFHPIKENFVRQSWKTVTNFFDDGTNIEWSDDDEEVGASIFSKDDVNDQKPKRQRKKKTKRKFDFSKPNPKRRRCEYYEKSGIERISENDDFFFNPLNK